MVGLNEDEALTSTVDHWASFVQNLPFASGISAISLLTSPSPSRVNICVKMTGGLSSLTEKEDFKDKTNKKGVFNIIKDSIFRWSQIIIRVDQ